MRWNFAPRGTRWPGTPGTTTGSAPRGRILAAEAGRTPSVIYGQLEKARREFVKALCAEELLADPEERTPDASDEVAREQLQ